MLKSSNLYYSVENVANVSDFSLVEPAWLWDFLRYEIENRLRAVYFSPGKWQRQIIITGSG